jgi:SnoaL-like protein
MEAFRRAVEARDVAAVTALLAPNVAFHSPVSHKPYHGRDLVGFILAAVLTIFEDFEYVDALEHEEHSVLRFRAHIGDRQLEGVDLLELDDNGRIATLTVMVRPLSALQALAENMAVHFAARGPR